MPKKQKGAVRQSIVLGNLILVRLKAQAKANVNFMMSKISIGFGSTKKLKKKPIQSPPQNDTNKVSRLSDLVAGVCHQFLNLSVFFLINFNIAC